MHKTAHSTNLKGEYELANRPVASRESVAYQNEFYTSTAPQKHKQQEQLRVVSSRKKRRARALRTQQLACFAIVLTIAGVILYSQMTLTSLTREASVKQSTLADLESEYVSLKTQQDRALSLGYVEDYAQNQLGMVKMDSSQIEYIEINNPDRIEATQPSSSLSGMVAGLSKSFSAILEYLG